MPARAQLLFQFREHAGAQMVALRLHVQKRAADENRTRTPHRGPHQLERPKNSHVAWTKPAGLSQDYANADDAIFGRCTHYRRRGLPEYALKQLTLIGLRPRYRLPPC